MQAYKAHICLVTFLFSSLTVLCSYFYSAYLNTNTLYIPSSLLIYSQAFLEADPYHSAEILWFSVKWKGHVDSRTFKHLIEEVQPHVLFSPPTTHSARTFSEWHEEYTPTS